MEGAADAKWLVGEKKRWALEAEGQERRAWVGGEAAQWLAKFPKHIHFRSN